MDYQQRNQQRGGQRAGNNGSAGPNRAPMVQPTNSGPPPMNNIQTELLFMRQEAAQVRSAIYALEEEKDSLRKAIRKLKLENTRVRQKVKRLQETVNQLRGVDDAGSEPDLAEQDYDEIGHNFILVGGIQDPLSSSFDSKIKDENNVEHRSMERLYYYKIAEHFNDDVAKKKILESQNSEAAESAIKGIQNYSEKIWNEHRVDAWRDAQKMKLDQHRDILNLLVLSKGIYIGLASHDKYFGTGWRKNREESNKPVFWDGENMGGKILMHLRDEYAATHTFNSKEEEEDAEKKFSYNRRFIWRRLDSQRRAIAMGAPPPQMIVHTGLGNRRGFFNNRRGMPPPMGYGAPSYFPQPNSYNHPPPPPSSSSNQQWANKKREGSSSGSQYH